jgi:hypothetical protein
LGFFNISNSEDRQFWLFEKKIRMKDSRILVISQKKKTSWRTCDFHERTDKNPTIFLTSFFFFFFFFYDFE